MFLSMSCYPKWETDKIGHNMGLLKTDYGETGHIKYNLKVDSVDEIYI